MNNNFHPLRQLDTVLEESESRSAYTGTARWMIPYADFMTLLLGFFIILFAMVKMENQELAQALTKSRQQFAPSASAEHYEPGDASQMIQRAADQLPVNMSQESAESMRSLEESLIKELNLTGQQITVSQDSRGVILSFQERIFFAPGKATLSPQAEETLNKLSKVLKKTNHPIRVEGHTDNSPIKTASFPSNWELSTARSTTIVRNLIERHHFPPQQLSAAGYGEFHPLADNSTIGGKQKNRRVDIVLLNSLSGTKDDSPHSDQNSSME